MLRTSLIAGVVLGTVMAGPVMAQETGARADRQSGRAWWRPVADRGWLGVRLASQPQAEQAYAADELDDTWLQVLNLPWLVEEWDGQGAMVLEVFSDTPAEEAGLLPGDVVRSFNGVRTPSPGVLAFIAQRAVVGRDAELEVLRDGDVRQLLLQVGMHPADARRLEEEARAAEEGQPAASAPGQGADR